VRNGMAIAGAPFPLAARAGQASGVEQMSSSASENASASQVAQAREFAAPGLWKFSFSKLPRIGMRQGITGRRRHVAPALLLC
jgi:hypothetical protein